MVPQKKEWSFLDTWEDFEEGWRKLSGIFHEEDEVKDILGRERGRAGQKVTDSNKPGELDRNP